MISDLDSFLVHDQEECSTSKTSIAVDNDLGRVVISNIDTKEGECVIREKPILVWKSHMWMVDYLEKFLELSIDHQAIVLDMFNEDVFNPQHNMRIEQDLQLIPNIESKIGSETLRQLIRISLLNCHAYYGYANVEYIESIGGTTSSGKQALFAYSSKVAHSCMPNVAYASKNEDGFLEYIAIRKISNGDQITFSYIKKIFSTPTFERRLQLKESKGFFCKCLRCTAPDHCRVHQCPNSNYKVHVLCVCADNESPTQWVCPNCGPIDIEMVENIVKREDMIRAKLESLQLMARSPGWIDNVPPCMIDRLVHEAGKYLVPIHYLNLQLLETKCKLCASHSAAMQQAIDAGIIPSNFRSPSGTIAELRAGAANAGLQFVSRVECVAVGCTGCGSDGRCVHPPVYECGTEIFHAYQDLKHVPSFSWPRHAIPMLDRYVPLLYIMFGTNDSDVKEIEDMLEGNSRKVRVNDSISSIPFIKAPTSAKKGNKKKKRKNKKKNGKSRK